LAFAPSFNLSQRPLDGSQKIAARLGCGPVSFSLEHFHVNPSR
jgi:hypothetical protein